MKSPLSLTAFVMSAALMGAFDAEAATSALQVFPFPQPVRYTHHNDDFTVRVRTPGGVWQDHYEHNVKVDWDKSQKDASMVYFNFDGPVKVTVQKNNSCLRKVDIRPTAKGIKSCIVDDTVFLRIISQKISASRLTTIACKTCIFYSYD